MLKYLFKRHLKFLNSIKTYPPIDSISSNVSGVLYLNYIMAGYALHGNNWMN